MKTEKYSEKQVLVILIALFIAGTIVYGLLYLSILKNTENVGYNATSVTITYPKINETEYDIIAHEIQNISIKFIGRIEYINWHEFRFYHRNQTGELDERYVLHGDMDQNEEFVIKFYLGTDDNKNPDKDRKIIEGDVKFITNLLLPILNNPIDVDYEKIYIPQYYYYGRDVQIINLTTLYIMYILFLFFIGIIYYFTKRKKKK